MWKEIKLKHLEEGTVFDYGDTTYRVVSKAKPFPDGPKSDPFKSTALMAVVEPKMGGQFQPAKAQLLNGNFTVWVD